jgi:hypothetical protein
MVEAALAGDLQEPLPQPWPYGTSPLDSARRAINQFNAAMEAPYPKLGRTEENQPQTAAPLSEDTGETAAPVSKKPITGHGSDTGLWNYIVHWYHQW